MRKRLAITLQNWASRLYDDWHTTTLTHPDGSQVSFYSYGSWGGSWPDVYEFDCDCEEKDHQ